MKKETPATSSSEAFLDVSIMNGFETITRLGGYILMFAILSACISRWYIPHNVPGYLLTGILELTTGLYRLQPLILPDITKSILAVFLTASGGVCIAAQTRSLVTKELSVRSLYRGKTSERSNCCDFNITRHQDRLKDCLLPVHCWYLRDKIQS